VLVIFSDMRHHTRDLDLESGQSVSASALGKQLVMGAPAMLQGIEVYILGVDGAGKSTAYWQSLQKFWTEYFHRAGATLRRYSVLRELAFDRKLRESGRYPVSPLYMRSGREPRKSDDAFKEGRNCHFKTFSHLDESLDAQIFLPALNLPHVPAMNLAAVRELLL